MNRNCIPNKSIFILCHISNLVHVLLEILVCVSKLVQIQEVPVFTSGTFQHVPVMLYCSK